MARACRSMRAAQNRQQRLERNVAQPGTFPHPENAMNPKSTVSIAGHPVHAMLVPFVIAFYSGALLCDIAYASVMDPFWARAAFWLIGGGIVASAAAANIGLVGFIAGARGPGLRDAWGHL